MLWYVVALSTAIAAPLLLLSMTLAWRWVESEHRRLESVTLEAVDNTLSHIDQHIAGRIAMLQALATSPAFDAGDFERIDRQARELLDLQGSTIVLRELDGQQRVNTRLPFSSKLPRGTNVAADAVVLATGRPQVSGFYMGTASGGPLIRIVVPVVRDGRVRMTLTASLPPDSLRALLRSAGVLKPYTSVIADRDGVVIATSDEGGPRIGMPLAGLGRIEGERGLSSETDAAGEPVVLGYRRSPLSGWLVQVALPKATVDAHLYGSLLAFAAAATALCLVVAAAAWKIGHVLVSSQRAVAETVGSLELGDVLPAPRTSVREADRIGLALVETSARLREQTVLIAQANQRLEERVRERTEQLSSQAEVLRVTLDNMDQGLLLIAPDRSVSLANHRAVELLDLPAGMDADDPATGLSTGTAASRPLVDDVVDPAECADGSPASSRARFETRGDRILEVRIVPLPSGGEVRTYTDVSAARRAEAVIRESEERLRLIADHSSDMIVRSDLDTYRRYVSPGCRALLGYEPSELIGTKPLAGVHPDDAAASSLVMNGLREGRVDEALTQQRYRRRDGSWVWTEATLKLTRDAAGAPDGYVASVRDISTRKAVEHALRDSEKRLAYALDSGSDGLWDRDIAADRTWYSDRWHAMLGYGPGEINGSRRILLGLIHPDDLPGTEEVIREHLAGRTPVYEIEHRLRTKSGDYSWVLVRGRIVERGPDGSPLRMVGTQIDVDARKRAEGRIHHMARHDALTDLPNRAVFHERLERRLERVRHDRDPCAVLCLDLDRFKAVNDTHGHGAGDALLAELARRIAPVLRTADTFARIGGDEFAILIDEARDREATTSLASRLIALVGAPYRFGGTDVQVGLSVGVAFAPEHGDGVEAILRNADLALYRAKADGRDAVRVYEPEMDEVVEERRRLEVDLRLALQQGQFELRYQPIFDLEADRISGFEALVRWMHPTRGLLSPGEFIPLAEETGLIVPLGDWVLRTAIAAASRWPSDIKVAVNISSMQFHHASLFRAIVSSLDSCRFPAHRLELEVTESVLISDSESALAQLKAFREMGIRVALDDFGTGYSSLSYLHLFRFDKIKIGRCFVSEMDDHTTAAIVRAIVQLGIGLGMAITAEGVETAGQAERLRAERCTEIQGCHVGGPVLAGDVEAFLAAGRPARLRSGSAA